MTQTIWEILSVIGTVAFAISGAIVAMEEEFDILGVFILGFLTAFGGGAIRNTLIGLPMSALWNQSIAFHCALVSILISIMMPNFVRNHWKKVELLTDALGLAAFSIQGALYAQNLGQPLSAIIVAAVLTGVGGGLVRDVLARRQPVVLRTDIYAVWSILAAIVIHFKILNTSTGYLFLVFIITTLRLYGHHRHWQLPKVYWQKK